MTPREYECERPSGDLAHLRGMLRKIGALVPEYCAMYCNDCYWIPASFYLLKSGFAIHLNYPSWKKAFNKAT